MIGAFNGNYFGGECAVHTGPVSILRWRNFPEERGKASVMRGFTVGHMDSCAQQNAQTSQHSFYLSLNALQKKIISVNQNLSSLVFLKHWNGQSTAVRPSAGPGAGPNWTHGSK